MNTDHFSPDSTRERIRKNRFTDLELRVRDSRGTALAGRSVIVRQVSHDFLFGQIGFELLRSEQAKNGWDSGQLTRYQQCLKELYNAVTLPFYWGRYEPEEGHPRDEEMREAARWFHDNGFRVKGHPLCWHSVGADWLMKYPNRTVLEKQRARVVREVGAYAGIIDSWDVINEVVIMPRFDKYDNAITRLAREYGAEKLAETLFRDARSANPKATLILNDFDLGPEYERLIELLLKKGTPIDAIGLQTHQHQGFRGAERIWDYAERFSRFGLPLHFTENTFVSGRLMPEEIVDLNDYRVAEWPTTSEGEERQRRDAVEFYSLLYSHPAVQGITWWGLVDGAWLNAPNGLLRKDLSPKPSFAALKNLIKGEWWTTEVAARTDPRGSFTISAGFGRYEISVDGISLDFEIRKGDTVREISLPVANPKI